MGLVGAGGVSRSFLARMPSLNAQLGPIKGVSFAAARRLEIALRAGRAVPNYAALEFCSLVWIHVPENTLDATVRDFAEQTAMHRTILVICETQRDSTSFEVLRHRGARIATLNTVDESWKTPFVAEGHPEAMRAIRKTLTHEKRRLIELRPGTKHRFLAAMHMMSELLRPFTAAALACMQSAGVDLSPASELIEVAALRTLRASLKSGTKPMSAVGRQELAYALVHQVEQLRATAPREAELYAHALRLALEYGERSHRKAAAHAANRRS
jgi:hypothetical protein